MSVLLFPTLRITRIVISNRFSVRHRSCDGIVGSYVSGLVAPLTHSIFKVTCIRAVGLIGIVLTVLNEVALDRRVAACCITQKSARGRTLGGASGERLREGLAQSQATPRCECDVVKAYISMS